jgi:UPF0755 protein
MIPQSRVRVLLTTALFFLLCIGILAFTWLDFLHSSIVADEAGIKFKVHPGATYKTVSTDLYNQHILKHPQLFLWLFRWRGDTHQLKAGEYLFPKGTTPSSLIDQIVSGHGMVTHAFTIIPGSTFRQLRQILNNDDNLIHTTKEMNNADIMKQLGHPTLDPEGQFFPDTYYFVPDSSDVALLKRAFQTMQKKLNYAWQHRIANLPFHNPYEALTAASIIEKETSLNEERPIIAGVLVNRLKKDIKLQFDPTVIYGLGMRFDGTIYKRDLLENTPYNTYTHKGLPPTPISMPSIESIEAVMHPDANNYLYFVARGEGEGHQFSRTLAEHNTAVAESKKHQPGFFNAGLVKQYLVGSFKKKIFSTTE